MKKYKLENAVSLALSNRHAIIISAFLFLIGISAGVFLELSMAESDKMHAAEFLNQYLYPDVDSSQQLLYPNPFFSSTGSNLFMLAIMFISALSQIGFPVAYIVLIYKGLALGFSAGLLLESFAADGAAALCTSLLPQNLILIPAFIVAAAASQNHAVSSLRQYSSNRRASNHRHASGNKKSSRKPSSGCDCLIIVYILLALAVITGCAVESIIFAFLRV